MTAAPAPGIYIPPIRPLWTPGNGLRRLGRSLRRAMGAAGEADLIGNDGDVLLDDDGKVTICGDCCGCPDSVTVTVSGTSTSLCTGCHNPASGGGHEWRNHDNFDGDYVVAKSGETENICIYATTIPVSTTMIIDQYALTNCVTFTASSLVSGFQLVVNLDRTFPTNLIITANMLVNTIGGNQGWYVYIGGDGPYAYGASIGIESGTTCDSGPTTPSRPPSLGATLVVTNP